MKFFVVEGFQVSGFDGVPDLDAHLDQVLNELLDLGAEADLTATLTEGRVSFEVYVDAPSKEQAEAVVDDYIRRAIRRVGGSLVDAASPSAPPAAPRFSLRSVEKQISGPLTSVC